jgi:hypothetical protein
MRVKYEMGNNPYQLVPLIVQRVSEDSPTAAATPLGPVKPTLLGICQLELPNCGLI